ncbi:anthocyanidin 3-O-glucosyltransferase 7-like [Euphorbia lathyris]|uniref:anthocyanidin 3-O-glucosyltransferase 7-like n=1 Tax=Euphorbia lathyris TaxID=212925 RepID=UPI00331412D8
MEKKDFSGHVVVFAFPFGTHVTPLFSIINRIASLSPDTHFSFFCTLKANNSVVAKYSSQPNVKICDLSDGIPDGFVFSSGNNLQEIELFMEAAPLSFRDGIKAAVAETGKEITCLVTDAFFGFMAEMAEEMTVPWFACWTAAAISVSCHFYTDFIRDTFGAAGKEESLNLIPGMSKVQISDLPEGILFGNLDSIISQMLHKMGKSLPKADAVFINSFEELDPIITNDLKSKFKQLLNTGPFNLISPPILSTPPDPYGCIPWLNNQKPQSVVYVSFGTVATPPPHELLALSQAFEAIKIPFLWSLKDDARTNLPDGFIDRTESQGIVVPWTPQIEVLSHGAVGVFLTHCGWNSVVESIQGGVPMICRPFFGDQRLNGRLVQDVLEIGVQVEAGGLTQNGVLDCLDIVFGQDKGKKLTENVTLLKQVVHRAIQPQGSSYSNLIELTKLVTNAQLQSMNFV